MYTANQVADYVVDYCLNNNISISNLKLQKLMYYIWIDYYKKTRDYLFPEPFSAWKFGPVIPEVYYNYCMYGGFNILWPLNFDDVIDVKDKNIISVTINKYKNTLVSSLIEKTHKPDMPWDIAYKKGNRTEILFDDIIRLECGES